MLILKTVEVRVVQGLTVLKVEETIPTTDLVQTFYLFPGLSKRKLFVSDYTDDARSM